MPVPSQKAIRNRLLAALPAQEFQLLASNLAPIDLELGATLHRAGERIDEIYFPDIFPLTM